MLQGKVMKYVPRITTTRIRDISHTQKNNHTCCVVHVMEEAPMHGLVMETTEIVNGTNDVVNQEQLSWISVQSHHMYGGTCWEPISSGVWACPRVATLPVTQTPLPPAGLLPAPQEMKNPVPQFP